MCNKTQTGHFKKTSLVFGGFIFTPNVAIQTPLVKYVFLNDKLKIVKIAILRVKIEPHLVFLYTS